ncbi:MAG: DNRLRE domain-containing protein, partial [Clostridia bacterium]|nr:DNRLRE domain-containing protein [Clostridia bacterium]
DIKSLNLKYSVNVGDYRQYITAEESIANHAPHIERANRLLADGTISYYAEGLCPGFDDIAVWGWGTGPRKDERGENGEVYTYKWQSAVSNNFPMVTIPTWDDWGEATTIEPTLEYGTDCLETTRKYAAEYKGIAANTASLELPGWIYKIRKSTKDTAILAKMNEASELIAEGKFAEAEVLVKPIAESLGIPMTSKEFFNYPTTPTTPLVVKEEAPAPTKGANGEEIFAPTADTYIVKSTSKKVDSGIDTKIKVKSADSTNLTRHGFIKFNTEKTEVTEVKKATLRLYCTYASTKAEEIAGRDINLYAAGTDWTEQSFSWTLRPETSEKLADLESGSFVGKTWIEIDVTDYVKAHIGETFAFAILNEGADTKENHLEFSSKESASNTPELVIE